MEKYIIYKNQIKKVSAEEIFDLLAPNDLKLYQVNDQLYYSWALYDTWKEADEALRNMIAIKVLQKRM